MGLDTANPLRLNVSVTGLVKDAFVSMRYCASTWLSNVPGAAGRLGKVVNVTGVVCVNTPDGIVTVRRLSELINVSPPGARGAVVTTPTENSRSSITPSGTSVATARAVPVMNVGAPIGLTGARYVSGVVTFGPGGPGGHESVCVLVRYTPPLLPAPAT